MVWHDYGIEPIFANNAMSPYSYRMRCRIIESPSSGIILADWDRRLYYMYWKDLSITPTRNVEALLKLY